MNKKILVSLTLIGVVGAVAVGGTVAYLSSAAVSQNNVFAAGTLYLEAGRDGVVSWSNTPDGLLTLNNMAPGVTSQDYIIRFRNTGTIPGQLRIEPGSMVFTSGDIASAPAPNMSADQFARLVYLSKLQYDVIGDGLVYKGILSSVVSAADTNGDGKASLYEINQMPSYTIPGVLGPNNGEVDLKMSFTLGHRFDECVDSDGWKKNLPNPGQNYPSCVNDYDITVGEWNVLQGDGVKVANTFKLVQEGY